MNKEYMRMNKEVAFCRDGNDFDDLIFPELMAKGFEILQHEKKFVEMICVEMFDANWVYYLEGPSENNANDRITELMFVLSIVWWINSTAIIIILIYRRDKSNFSYL